MPILPPSLDDRRFDDLVEDLLARIPAHTPEWTNPRLGDPGRTLIELFAWLGDTLLYRANLIPERQRFVFLKLLGLGLKPATSSAGVVGLSYAQATELSATGLLPGASIKGPVPFETLAETTVLPITALAYYKRALNDDESGRMGEVISGLAKIHGIRGTVKAYETMPVFSEGRAEPDGVDVIATSADHALWLALLAPAASQPDQQDAHNKAVKKVLGGSDSGATALLSVGVVPALSTPALFEEIGPRAKIPVLWEITTQGNGPRETDYLTLEPLPGGDSSQGLSRPGVLRLPLPATSMIWAPDNDVGDNPHAGVGDTPPRLDDAEMASRLLAWLRLRPQPGQPVERLALSWIGINAVEIDQRVTVAGRVLGVSNGMADQIFNLPYGSVDSASLRIEVEEPKIGYRSWLRVDDLGSIGSNPNVAREARVFELDPEAGTLRFGDGVRGRVPELQMRIRLASGRFGGGRAGNLPALSLGEIAAKRIDGSPAPTLKVWQPLPCTGGEDAESLSLAEKRIPAFLRHRDRAVTAEDFKRLAFEAPGINVGRVEVLPRFKPRDRRFDVPGVVSVMALPAQEFGNPPNPRPDRPFIERLHAHLSVRTPLATELYVIGCEYVPLGIAIAVKIRDGFGRDAVLFEVRDNLRRHLWPLPLAGLDGQGWPLGRGVRERELEVDISRIAGVLEVSGLNLFQKVGKDWQLLSRNTPDHTQTLALQAWQLPELLSVVVMEGLDVPTDLRAVPNPFADANAVAVPVVPEIC
ncbi:MAG: baseplate J/gp47 family protein [Proteobacteria bacterium]|nr:baseplate J/gp47 family protein [Pseudomonadota bacterium]